MIRCNRLTIYVAAITLILVGVLLLPVQNVTMLVNVLVLTGLFCRDKKKIRQTFYQCLTVIFLIWYVTATMASAVMVITPSWHDSTEYNLFMGAAILLFSVLVKYSHRLIDRFYSLENSGYSVLIYLFILLFFSFVLTRYYNVIATESKRQWGIFCLSFLLLMLVVAMLHKRTNQLSLERRVLNIRIEQQQEYTQQIQSQFETMVTLKHYYTNLYHSLMPFIRDDDMEGLRRYFNVYITPIHQTHVESATMLKQIQSPIIRNLIDIVLGQAGFFEGIVIDLSIDGAVTLPDSLEMELFEILSVMLDNALEALQGQSGGLFRIEISSTIEVQSIMIANTLHDGINIESIYKRKQKRGDCRGYGLMRVREIVLHHPGLEHYTYKSGEYQGREVLVQHIRIMREGGAEDS